MNKVQFRQAIQDVAAKLVTNRFGSLVSKAIIPASYISGNPPLQQGHETASTFGPKTHKVLLPYSNIANKPTASDAVIFGADTDGNRMVLGRLVDASAAVIDSTSLAALRPVEPGNTVLLAADTEQSTTSSSYVEVKRFAVSRPGRYRIKGEMARSGGTTQAIVKVRLSDGTIVDASAAASQISLTYPTFGAVFSLDMTVTVNWGAIISVYLLNTSGPAQTGYIKNVKLCYTDIISALVPHDVVLVD